MGVLNDLKALLQGLQIAGKHLGRHAVTIQYPEQRDEIPERSRGMVVLLSDKETGELNCTACLLCEKACPTGAITIDAPRGEDKKKQLAQFVVDHTLCCFCGMCEEACNFCAIKLAPNYEYSRRRPADLVFDIAMLQQWGKGVPYEDTRRRKNPVRKIGPAAATEGANTTRDTGGDEDDKPARPAARKAATETTPEDPGRPAEGAE
ncbi:MAG TPA: NADH-quinone oxidoreductase subunit I [candidate division Zixibacteria bacterium]|nr:NADH-quinone oxidoreductase subunit I [candidate division Zixibacteria bacterium]MDD4916588.1 NADH-quinone oxidoreductase subunit I [candidate division Zixibacteria bacterium]MDM7973754.1 NADH-quinone oxidoreductase subunit I [candidate division Zixibacteria bacterium]HOD65479.1 NADH-quinone oxidoreductase subunit I [candidate division Zixibacteria bacterium]HOZ07271.1 NADH-quinone oxidoreductase subunit I [candidate division Zixibacteria bacterium]